MLSLVPLVVLSGRWGLRGLCSRHATHHEPRREHGHAGELEAEAGHCWWHRRIVGIGSIAFTRPVIAIVTSVRGCALLLLTPCGLRSALAALVRGHASTDGCFDWLAKEKKIVSKVGMHRSTNLLMILPHQFQCPAPQQPFRFQSVARQIHHILLSTSTFDRPQ